MHITKENEHEFPDEVANIWFLCMGTDGTVGALTVRQLAELNISVPFEALTGMHIVRFFSKPSGGMYVVFRIDALTVSTDMVVYSAIEELAEYIPLSRRKVREQGLPFPFGSSGHQVN